MLIVSIAATSDKMSDVEFNDLIDKRIQPLLARIEGVARVISIGGREREFQVNLDAKNWKRITYQFCKFSKLFCLLTWISLRVV
ncbi:MAG: efflux RND transporter permease subunit [Crocinitomicaceae bacterium]